MGGSKASSSPVFSFVAVSVEHLDSASNDDDKAKFSESAAKRSGCMVIVAMIPVSETF